MKLFSLVRAGILAALPFLFLTLASAHLVGSGSCIRVALLTPCLDLPVQDLGVLAAGLAAVYEAFARLVPTAHDYSLITLLGRIADFLQVNQAVPAVDGHLTMQHKAGFGLALDELGK